jgi:undecaprenyl diphosphate synthase
VDQQAEQAVDPIGGLHVAIIMDGNGRWATRRGRPRSAGHRAGVLAVRRVVEAAPELGVTTLTLFAFSSDNWRRPPAEVNALMALLRHYLRTELKRLVENGARLTVIGRRDRLPEGLSDAIADAEKASADGQRLDLRIALDYSARDAIARALSHYVASLACSTRALDPLPGRIFCGKPEVHFSGKCSCAAARWTAEHSPSREAFSKLLAWDGAGKDVDLLIRSGGEKRLSDFLLWEAAYAELCFVDTLWPDFGADDLAAAIADFRGRDRRFGALTDVVPLIAAE